MLFLLLLSSSLSYNTQQLNYINRLISMRRFWNAYQQLNAIIQSEYGDVSNILYRKRGECCMKMGMPNECLEDVDRILSNNPTIDDEKYAYMLQAQSLIQKGEFEEAKLAATKTGDIQLQRNSNKLYEMDIDASSKIEQGQIDEARQILDRLIQNAPKANGLLLKRADIAWISNDFEKFKTLSEQLEKEFTNDAKLFYRRGIVCFCDGEMDKAEKRIKYSKVLKYTLSNISEVLDSIKIINVHYPKAQSFVDLKDVVEAENEINLLLSTAEHYCLDNSNLISKINSLKIKLIKLQKTTTEAIDELTSMIEKNPDNVDLLLERGELYLEIEEYDPALVDFLNAQRHRPSERRAHEGINKAKELKKRKTYVDHYQTLGLQKGASSVEIKNSYKKMAREWHPDRFSDPQKKKEAESMMKKINTAYDILGDEYKKRLYDLGQDPDDPMAGRQQNFGGFRVFNMRGGRVFTFRNGGAQHFEFHY